MCLTAAFVAKTEYRYAYLGSMRDDPKLVVMNSWRKLELQLPGSWQDSIHQPDSDKQKPKLAKQTSVAVWQTASAGSFVEVRPTKLGYRL